jgi:hypothetical protein
MNIREKLTPIADEIVNISQRARGRNIGTGLQMDLEESMTKIIPPEIGYNFHFDMSSHTSHIFYEKNNPNNFIEI